VGAVLSYPIAAVFAALLLFILCKIMRGPAGFQHYFSLYAHVYVISALCAVVSMGAYVAFDNMLDILSLAAVFMPGGNNADMAFNVLSAVNLPTVWTAVLITLGVRAVNGWPLAKAVIAGAVAFAFSVAVTAASLGATFLMFDYMDRIFLSF
jgi:hypothetical protein